MAKVDDYLTKPFAPQELLAAVERVLIKYSKPLPTEEEKEQGRIWAETFARSHAQLSEEMIGCCIQLLDEIAPSLPNVKRNGHSVLVRGQRGQYEVSLVTGRVTRLPNKSVCIVPKLYQASDLNLCLPFEDASANVQKIISTVLMLSADQDIHDNAILRQLER
jgi:hypothetical protein